MSFLLRSLILIPLLSAASFAQDDLPESKDVESTLPIPESSAPKTGEQVISRSKAKSANVSEAGSQNSTMDLPIFSTNPYTNFGYAKSDGSSRQSAIHFRIPFRFAGPSNQTGAMSIVPTKEMQRMQVSAEDLIIYDTKGNLVAANQAINLLSSAKKVCLLEQPLSHSALDPFYASTLKSDVLLVYIPVESLPQDIVDTDDSVTAISLRRELAKDAVPLARFRFNSPKFDTYRDNEGCCIAELTATTFSNGGLVIGNGVPVQCEILDLDYAALAVSFAFKVEDLQANSGNIFVCGRTLPWLSVDRLANGNLSVSLMQGAFRREIRGMRLLKNNWNLIAVSLDASKHQLLVSLNGLHQATVPLSNDACEALEKMKGNDDEKCISFGSAAGGIPIAKYVDDFNVFGAPLGIEQLHALVRVRTK